MRQTTRVPLDLIRLQLGTGRTFWFFTIIGLCAFALYGFVFATQLIVGHGVTGQDTPVGAVWGLYVAAIIFFIGVSHVGIGVSAATRLLNLDSLKPYARMAEFLTMVCLPAAVLLIAIDIGRPERFLVNVMIYGRLGGPFLWSAVVISVYLFASAVYLYLSLRRDISLSADAMPNWLRWLYKKISLGYKDTKEQRALHSKTLWWLALALIPIMVSVHSVYGLVFGLHASRAAWFNPFMAPYFVLGALVNGFATLVIVVALVRKLFKWEQYLKVEAIRTFGRFLSWMAILYIYFSIAEYLTLLYAPPAADTAVANALMTGEFSVIFWPTMIALVVGFLLLFFNQTIFHNQFRLWITVVAAIVIDIVMFATRYLIVVPSLLYPQLPYPQGTYVATWYEWAAIIGVLSFAIGAYAVLMKLFPVVELPESTGLEATK